MALPASSGNTESAQRRAYPFRALKAAGGVVNETVGTTHIAVFYDPQSEAATALSANMGGKTLKFELRASDGNIGIFDTSTGTRWSIEGLGIAGKLKGKQLQRLDCHLSQWYGWSACFPDTTIYGTTDAPKPGNPFVKQESNTN